MNVSIVIVNWNTRKLLIDAVQSIKKTTHGLDYEIIIVDNASNDDSIESLKKLKIKELKIIQNESNLGFAKANNIGIKKAKYEYILLLNSDTKVKVDSIYKLVEFAKNNPDAGVIGARLLNVDGTLQPSVYRLPTIARTIKQYWFHQNGLLDKYTPISNAPQKVEVVVGAAFLITPAAIKKVSLLSSKYFMYFEDLDYCREMKKENLKVYYLPEAEIFHYHGASGKSMIDSKDQWRRLIPSSKIYHGVVKHYLIWFITWSGQKFARIIK